jgi:hypothetical protein
MTTIFDALRSSHRDVEELFGDLQNAIATQQVELAKTLFQLVSMKLIASMSAEHAVVYPRFAHEANLGDEVAQALREHDGITRMIDLLRIGGLDYDDWCESVAQLGGLVADHSDCEECVLFPIAGLSLSTEALHTLAAEYEDAVKRTRPISGASITYALPEPELARPVIVHFRAA